MASVRSVESRNLESSSAAPDDGFLVAGVVGGDAAALTKLIDRYDRLVRYTIYRASADRCVRDPEWLDSVASAVWSGFVRSITQDPDRKVQSVRAYIAHIARNQTVSALRQQRTSVPSVSIDAEDAEIPIADTLEDPEEHFRRLEMLDVLRECMAELDQDDRTLVSQLGAITERRWRDAAEALGLKESTLRSRWKRSLGRLRACLQLKTGEIFAPGASVGDL